MVEIILFFNLKRVATSLLYDLLEQMVDGKISVKFVNYCGTSLPAFKVLKKSFFGLDWPSKRDSVIAMAKKLLITL